MNNGCFVTITLLYLKYSYMYVSRTDPACYKLWHVFFKKKTKQTNIATVTVPEMISWWYKIVCLCVFQKYKEYERAVRVEEIDGLRLVKRLAEDMEEMFHKKAEAMKVPHPSH